MKEMQERSNTDLVGFIHEKREELRSLRFTSAGSSMRDVRAIRKTRKELAQAQTELALRNKSLKQKV
jgi:ribosomal protein L29